MKYRQLGHTGFKVSEIGFGAWAVGGNEYGNSYGSTKDEDSIAAIQQAVELGCNFYDTADVYGHGHSESILGTALKKYRDNVFVATKVGGDFYHNPPRMNFASDYVKFAVEKSCERLQTNHIDLYQLHNPPLNLVRDGKVFDIFEKLKESGKITHYGISIHDPREGIIAMKSGQPATIQVVFNILRQEAKNELIPAAYKNDVGLIAREPLANGFLTGKLNADSKFEQGDIRYNFPRAYLHSLTNAAKQLQFLKSQDRSLAQSAIRFVLDHREISTVIPGGKTAQQVVENLRASETSPLTGEDLLRIRIMREEGLG
jgi:aryl-alcohol dehydrogenase-like predicted oxidoreductase